MAASADKAGRVALIFNARPECATCPRAEVRDAATARVVASFDLPTDATATPGASYDRGSSTLGFEGRLLWVYNYVPAHNSDVMGTHSDERCGYEVYDTAHGGARVRQLATATGDWR